MLFGVYKEIVKKINLLKQLNQKFKLIYDKFLRQKKIISGYDVIYWEIEFNKNLDVEFIIYNLILKDESIKNTYKFKLFLFAFNAKDKGLNNIILSESGALKESLLLGYEYLNKLIHPEFNDIEMIQDESGKKKVKIWF